MITFTDPNTLGAYIELAQADALWTMIASFIVTIVAIRMITYSASVDPMFALLYFCAMAVAIYVGATAVPTYSHPIARGTVEYFNDAIQHPDLEQVKRKSP